MTEKSPWIKVKSKIVYKNDWITVREDDVIRPDGKPGIYGVVETRIATGVVAITPNNEVYLVGQYRYPIDRYSWEIIEGGTELGEDPLDCAKRELREEGGLIAAKWEELGPPVYLSNCHSNELALFFLARELTEVETQPEGTEVLQLKLIPLAEVFSMVDSGEITDAMSVIALTRIRHMIATNLVSCGRSDLSPRR